MTVQETTLGYGDVSAHCDECHKRLCSKCYDDLIPDNDLYCFPCSAGDTRWLTQRFIQKNITKHEHLGED